MEEFDPCNFRILIVDDIPANINVLGNTLHTIGYSFEFSTSGKAALQWLEKKEFDLILLDVMMPEMNGFEVCEKIRENKEWNSIPIIFLTAKTDQESLLEGFKIGAQDYLTKPFDSRELAARVRTHVELRYSRKRLQNINKELEEKVKERTQELAVANAALQDLDNAKNDFLKVISHELRTPLNGIVGPLQIIANNNKNADLNRWVSMLEESVGRLERFSVIALRITELQMSPDFLCREDVNLLRSILKTIDVKSEIDKKRIDTQGVQTGHELFADAEIFQQCLDILLGNALDHSPVNENVYICSKTKIERDYITIANAGHGFSDAILKSFPSLFSNASEHIDGNTGLPLVFVYHAIVAHGGMVELRNTSYGAEVELFLPHKTR